MGSSGERGRSRGEGGDACRASAGSIRSSRSSTGSPARLGLVAGSIVAPVPSRIADGRVRSQIRSIVSGVIRASSGTRITLARAAAKIAAAYDGPGAPWMNTRDRGSRAAGKAGGGIIDRHAEPGVRQRLLPGRRGPDAQERRVGMARDGHGRAARGWSTVDPTREAVGGRARRTSQGDRPARRTAGGRQRPRAGDADRRAGGARIPVRRAGHRRRGREARPGGGTRGPTSGGSSARFALVGTAQPVEIELLHLEHRRHRARARRPGRDRRRSRPAARGTTCHETPNRSFSQPHWLGSPPPASSASQ